jgi:H/ACA ribonucleoprotein complex subunit 4
MGLLEKLITRSIVIINKPRGSTSREVVDQVKKILGCKKAGHVGTLDSNATGVLVVALNESIKAVPVLMGVDKEYEGIMYLHKDVDLERLGKVIKEKFVGEIIQTPPVKSRVARKPRKRIVYNFEILEKNGKNIRFKTKVQAGTYIRKLVSDIGEFLQIGAHLKELKRTKVGQFSIEDSHSLEEVKAKKSLGRILIPLENAIPHVKRVYIKDSSIPKILYGSPIFSSDITKASNNVKSGEIITVFSNDGKIIALGISKTNDLRKAKGSVIKTDRIFLM